MLKVTSSLPDADVRNEQIEEARRLAAEEGVLAPRRTLHVKPGHESRPRSTSMVKKPAGAPKGHEAFLKALETSGAEIEIEKCDGNKIRGFVKHSDKYTVSVRCEAAPGSGIFKDRVIFKHDISEFSAVSPRAAVPDSKTEEGYAV